MVSNHTYPLLTDTIKKISDILIHPIFSVPAKALRAEWASESRLWVLHLPVTWSWCTGQWCPDLCTFEPIIGGQYGGYGEDSSQSAFTFILLGTQQMVSFQKDSDIFNIGEVGRVRSGANGEERILKISWLKMVFLLWFRDRTHGRKAAAARCCLLPAVLGLGGATDYILWGWGK